MKKHKALFVLLQHDAIFNKIRNKVLVTRTSVDTFFLKGIKILSSAEGKFKYRRDCLTILIKTQGMISHKVNCVNAKYLQLNR